VLKKNFNTINVILYKRTATITNEGLHTLIQATMLPVSNKACSGRSNKIGICSNTRRIVEDYSRESKSLPAAYLFKCKLKKSSQCLAVEFMSIFISKVLNGRL